MADTIREEFAGLIRKCVQCGTCTAACPTSDVSEFHIRRLVRRLQLGIHNDSDFLSRIPWLCTQCARCELLCSEGLGLPELILTLRKSAIEQELSPNSARQLVEAIETGDSPYTTGKAKSAWADDLVKVDPEAELLYWVGCSPSMRSWNLARATAKVLDRLCGGFRLLEHEPCCGEPLYVLGQMDEVRATAEKTIAALKASGVKRIVTSCAGCFNSFSNIYPEKLGLDMEGLEIYHTSQLLAEMAELTEFAQPNEQYERSERSERDERDELPTKQTKTLKLAKPLKATYHDPCSLGRHAGVYDAPRQVLNCIDGLEFVELDPTRERSLCCGGGGGLWSAEHKLSLEIARNSIERSLPEGTEALVTCCPMCYNTFRLALRRARSPVKVYELVELVAMALDV